MRKRIAIVLLPVLLLSTAGAFELLGSSYGDQTLQFQLGDVCDSTRFPLTPGACAGTTNEPDWRTEFTTGIGRWNGATSLFSLSTDPATGASSPGTCSSSDPNSVFFLDDICGAGPFGGSTLAVARTWFDSLGRSVHSDIIFNTAYTWRAFDDAFSNHPGEQDFRRTAVHEIGHTMGLAHPYTTSAVMYFQSQSGVIGPQTDDLAGLKARYGVMDFAAVDDYTGNLKQEIATVRSANDQSFAAEIRDGSSGALLKIVPFLSTAFKPIGIVSLGDADGNGAKEIGVLAVRRSDGRALVEIRNVSGQPNPRIVWFATNATPLKVISVPDADGNGTVELAVLMRRNSDLRTFVEIKNAFGPTAPNVLWMAFGHFGRDLVVVDDADANNIPEIAVLSFRNSDNRGVVEIKNAAGATNPNAVWAAAGVSVIALATVPDADNNGIDEVAILSTRDSDDRILVEVKNAAGATLPNALWYALDHDPRAIASIDDADGNGVPEVAVLSRRIGDGRIVVETKNASGSTLPNAMWYSPGYAPFSTLTILDDIDGNSVPEAAVMLFRNSDGRITIQQRNASGANAARNIWVSP